MRRIILTDSGWWFQHDESRWHGPYRWRWLAAVRSWF